MFVYFKIRYLANDEYEVDEQVSFIRAYVEDICEISRYGLRFDGYVEHKSINENKGKVVLAKYRTTNRSKISKIKHITERTELLDEMLMFVAI